MESRRRLPFDFRADAACRPRRPAGRRLRRCICRRHGDAVFGRSDAVEAVPGAQDRRDRSPPGRPQAGQDQPPAAPPRSQRARSTERPNSTRASTSSCGRAGVDSSTNFGSTGVPRDADAGGDVGGGAVCRDVDARHADRAIERDRAGVELEAAAGEIEVAAHQRRRARDRRIGDRPGDAQVRAPFGVEAAPEHHDAARRRDLKVELHRAQPGRRCGCSTSSSTWFGKLTRRRPGMVGIDADAGCSIEMRACCDGELAGDRDVFVADADGAVARDDGEAVIAAERAQVVGLEGDAALHLAIPGDRRPAPVSVPPLPSLALTLVMRAEFWSNAPRAEMSRRARPVSPCS